jgi:hypothetical protein
MESPAFASVAAFFLIPVALLALGIILYAVYRTVRGRIRHAGSVARTPLRFQFDVATGTGQTMSDLLIEVDGHLSESGYALADQTSNSLTWVRVLSGGSTVGIGGFDSGVLVGSAARLPPNVRRVSVSVYERDGEGSRVAVLGASEPWMTDWLMQMQMQMQRNASASLRP